MKRLLVLLFFLVWISVFLTTCLIPAGKSFFLMLSQPLKNLEEKKLALWGDFYRFMQFCKDEIPRNKDVIFFNPRQVYEKSYGPGRGFVMWEWHRQYAGYELYPRRVHALSPGGKEKADYIIIYGQQVDFPCFGRLAEFGKGRYILKREG